LLVKFNLFKNLPILFICENNLYSVYSPLEARQPKGRSIAKMVSGMGIEVGVADGSDIFESYDLLLKSVNRIRAQNGPIFLEFSTYRWREHCGSEYDNNLGYRTEEEFLFWQQKDPLKIIENKLSKNNPNKFPDLFIFSFVFRKFYRLTNSISGRYFIFRKENIFI
jgi:pyruvate dehydrogenase E1 component alpha subunit